MNKTELIQAVVERSEEKKAVVERVIGALLEVIPETLAAGKEEEEKIQITGFGSFSTSYTEGRTGRNPRNPEEEIEIPASYRIYFSAGQGFKDVVNGKVKAEKKVAKKAEPAKKVAKKVVKKKK